MTKIRNARFNASGCIDCEICHPALGWIPFTADPADGDVAGSIIFDEAKKKAKPYAPPRPPSEEEMRAEVEGWADSLMTGTLKDRAVGMLLADLWARDGAMTHDEARQYVRDRFRDHLMALRGLTE